MRRTFIALFLLFPTLAFAQYDDLAQKTMAAWKLPGMAVAVVQNDRVIYLKAFGVRDAATNAPMTPDTLIEIASTTKAFTTTAMAMLVDEKKLRWDDPVRKHIEYFHLGDPCADAQVTLRDIVSHRTGLSRHDELWDYNPDATREQIIRSIADVKLTKPFRSAYQYQNIMFSTAGEAVASAAKMPWQEFMRTRVFEPIGMTRTRVSLADFLAAEHSESYRWDSKELRPIMRTFTNYDNIAPAGTIKSTARDMAQWLRFQLASGAINGRRLVSEDALNETKSPQTIIPMTASSRELAPETNITTYGLGWNVQDYRGELLVGHGGALNGFRTQVALLPKRNAGVFVMTNINRGYGIIALRNQIMDRLLGGATRDWNQLFLDAEKKADERAEKSRAEKIAKRVPNTTPSHALDAYAGTYENASYGTVNVRVDNGALVFKWNRLEAKLAHVHYDTFNTYSVEEELDEDVQFHLAADGSIKSLTLFGEEFTRKKKDE